jgi:tRNA 2-thiouridine synthesizing protein E
MAREQGLKEIEEPHWRTIRFLREYYFTHGKAPLSRDIRKGTGLSLMEIEHLFPGGLKEGARRMAGLPNPRGCM